MQNILYLKNMINNVRHIYLLIQEASRGDGVGLHLRSYWKVVKCDQNN